MKHTSGNVNQAAKRSGVDKSTQKYIVIGALVVLAVVIVVSLVVILNGNNAPIGDITNTGIGSGTNGYYPGSYNSPNDVLQYSDGEVPTTGSRHDITVTGDGGPQAMDLLGNWRLENTLYKFDGYGRGIMLLNDKTDDNNSYTFAYSAINGHLQVDYDKDVGMDCDYTYTISNDKLILKRGTAVFEMTKEP